MRVLFSSGAFWPVIGGVEVRAAKLLPALRDRGHEFIVVTGQSSPDLPAQATFQGIPIYRFPFGEIGQNLNRLTKIQQQIQELKRSFAPDLIHRNGVGADGLFCLTAAKAPPVPLVVTLINDLLTHSTRQDSLLGHLLRSADWVTTVSAAALVQTRALVPEIISRSTVIHSGLQDQGCVPPPLPTDVPRLLCLGRLVPQKGFDIALQALSTVVKRFSKTRLVIAGDGPERVALEQQAVQMGLAGAVDFLGWVPPDQIPAVLGSATVVVMPSRWEGLPNVALQAALMARPVVGARVGGLPEIIEHGKTGLLVAPEDSAALVDAITFLLGNPETATRIGQAAQARVQNEFSWERYVDAYDTLYRKLGHTKANVTSVIKPAGE